MKNLPIGISTLSEIVEKNRVYIDKTHFVAKLAKGKYYFLSRPRRFGKSLFIDTLKQAFLGNKALFQGLYLENHWDWSRQYPVIHFDFGVSSAYLNETTLLEAIWNKLNHYAKAYDITLTSKVYSNAFQELIRGIYEATRENVVILVDEYDKPLLDVIERESDALVIREILKGLYGVIKSNDAYIRFVLLTGVSKFSKVGIFSGLNNLNDITLDAKFADICGYTQAELEQCFSDYLHDGQVDKEKLKSWYNGYCFAGTEAQKVYNPFDILLFFENRYAYRNYWFESGSSSFLIKLIKKNQYYFPNMENIIVSDTMLSSFEIDVMPVTVLLFQAGYLTIKRQINVGEQYSYVLSYPNREVKLSLNDQLAAIGSSIETKQATLSKLAALLDANQIDQLGQLFNSHFASIPHDWYRNNPIGQYEGFYASIVYSFFCALGYQLIAEDATHIGKIDLAVVLPDKILILEFKLKKYGDGKEALQQIKEKRYAEKYRSHQKPIYLVGMSFDEKTRTVFDSVSERL